MYICENKIADISVQIK